MIHPPDVIPKYAPYAPIGNLGAGGTAADDDDDEDDDEDEEEEEEAGGEGGGYTIEEVAKHTSKTDCWVVVSGQVLDVTKFLGEHPGGELAILTFGGKDATEEFNMIHPPDVIPKYAPYAPIGLLGEGGDEAEDDDDDDDEAEDDDDEEAGGYSMEEVAKHTSKTDCWVVVSGQVLDVTKFLSEHPG